MRRFVSEAKERADARDARIDAQRTIAKEVQPAYLALVHQSLDEFLPDFICATHGHRWYDAILGWHDCEFRVDGKMRVLLVTFDASERSPNKFVINPSWFETDGRNTPLSVDGDRLRRAFQGWLRGKSQPAAVVSSVPRRKNVLLRGGC